MGSVRSYMNRIESLITLGFCFSKAYGPNGKFSVSKHPVYENPTSMEEQICESIDEALVEAEKFLETPNLFFWSAIVRFNRGLGIEYKNLADFEAVSYEEAIKMAKIEAEKLKKDPKIIILEIKVRLKNLPFN